MKKRIAHAALYLFCLALTLLLLFSAYRAQAAAWEYGLAVVSFVFSCFLIPVLHECGHLAIGKICKMNFISVSFPFVTVYKENGKIHCKSNFPRHSDAAGSCCMYPADAKNVEKRFLRFASGGILSGILYFVLCGILVLVFHNAIVCVTLGMTLPYCAYLTILNLFPENGEKGAYDGALIWGLLKKEPSATIVANIFAAQGFVMRGSRPREIPESLLFGLPQLPEDDPNFTVLKLWQYAVFLDGGKTEEAAKCVIRLEDCLNYLPGEYLIPVFCELTYVYAMLVPDEKSAQEYYERLATNVVPVEYAADAYRAEAAFALSTKNTEIARESIRRAEEALSASGDAEGMKKMKNDLLSALCDKIKTAE